jgi:hypothetical protein
MVDKKFNLNRTDTFDSGGSSWRNRQTSAGQVDQRLSAEHVDGPSLLVDAHLKIKQKNSISENSK